MAHPTKIKLNGTEYETNHEVLSYEDLVKLAYPRARHTAGCSITWHVKLVAGNRSHKVAGMLMAGERLAMINGIRVEAYFTSNA